MQARRSSVAAAATAAMVGRDSGRNSAHRNGVPSRHSVVQVDDGDDGRGRLRRRTGSDAWLMEKDREIDMAKSE